MHTVEAADRPLTKVSGDWRGMGKGPHDDVEIRVAYGLFHMATASRFISNVSLQDIRLTKVDDGWRVILKGARKKKKLVAFFYASTLKEALVLAVTSVDAGYVDWVLDRPWKPGPRQ